MSSEKRNVRLISKEGEVFEVPASVAKMSQLVAETLDGDDDDDDDSEDSSSSVQEVPLPNVRSEVLQKVMDYAKHYQQVEQMTPIQPPLKSNHLDELVQKWYSDFVTDVDQELLFDMVAAANFMDIKPLLDLSCLAVSIRIKGKTAEELREMFHMSAEITPEEKRQVEEENSWVERPPSHES